MISKNKIETNSPAWILNHVVGSSISFEIELWDKEGLPCLEFFTGKVLRVGKDPLGRHEAKCFVEIKGERYGIPLSEIKEFKVKNGEQLELF